MMMQALHYLKLGLSVIPIAAKRKEPPLIEYKKLGFTEHLPTEEEVRNWWAKWPNANIAIVTGRVSGITVIDVDRHKGGVTTLTSLGLQSAVMASASKGGLHLFFKYTDTMKTWVEKLGQGLDVRNDGGYIIAAPSFHPCGKRYVWLTPGGFNRSWLTDVAIRQEPVIAKPDSPLRSVIEDALTNMAPGMRHYQFSRVIGKLNTLGVKPIDIMVLLKPYADSNDFPEADLKSQVERMCALYSNQAPSLYDEKTYDLSQFLAEEEKVDWISDGFLAKKVVGFVAGLPESFKTWLLIDLSIEAARGGYWLGRFPTSRCKVLYIDQERFKGETKRRFAALLSHKNLKPAELDGHLYLKCGTTIRIDLTHSFEAFKAELAKIKPDLIIVDSFATFHTKEENSRTEMQTVLERIKLLRNEFGCTFLFIDHENKGVFSREKEGALPSSLDMVGSIAKPAAAEFMLTVRKDSESTCIVHHTKSTLGATVDPFTVQVLNVTADKKQIKVESMWNLEHTPIKQEVSHDL